MTTWRHTKTRVTIAVFLTVCLALIVITGGAFAFMQIRLNNDARQLAQDRAALAATTLTVDSLGHISMLDSPSDDVLDGSVWVFSGGKQLAAPSVSADVAAAAEALSGTASATFTQVDSPDTLLYALPVSVGPESAVVVTRVALGPYEEARRTAMIAIAIFDFVVLAAITLLAARMIHTALRPVAVMTTQAADWSVHQSDRRFEMGEPHDEITQLAATLDDLLDRTAQALAFEQRLSAEIAHELRTPLAVVIADADLALRRDRTVIELRATLVDIRDHAAELAAAIQTLIEAARSGPLRGPPTSNVAEVVEVASRVFAKTNRPVVVQPIDHSLAVAVELALCNRILAPILDNALSHGTGTVRICAHAADKFVVIAISDEGPRPTHGDVFDPGMRGPTSTSGGAGLGLPLARRLARGSGGDVTLSPADPTTFLIRLPCPAR